MYKDNLYFLDKMMEDVCFIVEHMKNETQQSLEENPVLADSMMFRLIQISENAAKLDLEFKEKHPEFAWGDISGLRNRIVHDYGNVNMGIVYETLKFDVLDLMNSLAALIKKA